MGVCSSKVYHKLAFLITYTYISLLTSHLRQKSDRHLRTFFYMVFKSRVNFSND